MNTSCMCKTQNKTHAHTQTKYRQEKNVKDTEQDKRTHPDKIQAEKEIGRHQKQDTRTDSDEIAGKKRFPHHPSLSISIMHAFKYMMIRELLSPPHRPG